MYARIFWINKEYPGKLGIMTRPSGEVYLKTELQNVRRAGVDILVSLLEEEEISKMKLGEEGAVVKELGMEFVHHPIPDRSIPENYEATLGLVKYLAKELEEGKNLVFHCRKSIGRSPMMAAAIMVWLGANPKKAFQHIKKIRRAQVPDQVSQLRWVEEVAAIAPSPTPHNFLSRSIWEKMFGNHS